mgnify:CR=1 FL=1
MRDKISFILNIIQTLVLIAILAVVIFRKVGPAEKYDSHEFEAKQKEVKPLKISESDIIWGNTDAPVSLVAFIDYECPYCKDLYSNIKANSKEYIETGKVKVVFRNLPLRMHKNARELAGIVECAGQQGKFWEMTDLLLTSKEKYDSTKLITFASQLGLDALQLQECLNNEQTLTSIKSDVLQARSRGISGTPAFFINDEFYRGTMSASDLKDAFEGKKIARKPKSGSCGEKLK